MIDNNFFKLIDRQLRTILQSNKPFGAISVIAVGDLFQLPPVQNRWIFKDLKQDYGPLATSIWKSLFSVYELTQVMRRKNKDFAQLRNRLREHLHMEEDVGLLKTPLIKKP